MLPILHIIRFRALKSSLVAVFIALTGLMFFVPSLDAFAQGPGAGWLYSRVIVISPSTPSAYFQVKVTLVAGQYTHMNADGSDLRFYDYNNVNCSYWIEKWNNTGTSVIWVKVPSSGTFWLRMYYGNSSASAESNGSNTFDFFDDFAGTSLGANWSSNSTYGTITVSGGQVTLSNTTGGSNTPAISSAFTPGTTSFYIEAKHKETSYNRNRFYAATTLNGDAPTSYDYGLFLNVSVPQIFWNGWTGIGMTANTEYLTRWLITDGSTYNWYQINYSTGAVYDTRTTTVTSTIRYISFKVTEGPASTIIDWVRVRKYTANEPALSLLGEIAGASQVDIYTSSASITIPGCVTGVTVEAWGAGGGGSNRSGAAGGGGGGAFTKGFISGLVSGNPMTITVGTGGGAGSPTSSPGNYSRVTYGSSIITANGGLSLSSSRTGGAGGTAQSVIGIITAAYAGGAGGNARNSANNPNNEAGGGGGGSAFTNANGNTGSNGGADNSTGTAGGTGTGIGGYGASADGSPDATVGYYPGGGGGGRGEGTSTSKSGADGLVILSWTNLTPPSFSTSKTNISCYGGTDGSITLTASGGTTPYYYRYNKDGGGWIGGDTNGWIQFTANPQVISTNLGQGVYTIEVKDANGCVQTTCSQTL